MCMPIGLFAMKLLYFLYIIAIIEFDGSSQLSNKIFTKERKSNLGHSSLNNFIFFKLKIYFLKKD